ncbi:MAG: ABC transporter ATP-binding protein [Nitrospiraceae bacterium]
MITLTDVWLTLGERQVLKEISLNVPAGETKVILGGSGSGKTTILRVILGLYRPDRGSLLVDGQDITAMRERDLPEIRQRMAMVFQGAALFDSLTVRENVGYRLWEQGRLSDAMIEKSVRESLQFVGLEHAIDKMPAELSGGMKKRVGIARALASGARVILYDEPTAGLDPINTCTISRLIQLLKSKGVTQVVVTHDLATAYRVADRIVMIHKGRMIFEGNPKELQRSADPDIRAFLDPGSQSFDAEAFAASEIGEP